MITLYDVQSTLEEKTLSPYVVRLRLVLYYFERSDLDLCTLYIDIRLFLDYRKISYETVWIDFPEVEATAKAVGAPPTMLPKADGTPGYTVPFVTIASPNKPTIALSDSFTIVEYLNKEFPDPTNLLLPSETRVFQKIFSKYLADNILRAAVPFVVPGFVAVQRKEKQAWFIETRKKTLGATLEDVIPVDEANIALAWKKFEAAFDDLAAHLDKGGEGNYRVTGNVSYAEFELVSLLNLIKRLTFEEGWKKRLETRNDGRWAKLMGLPIYKELLPMNL